MSLVTNRSFYDSGLLLSIRSCVENCFTVYMNFENKGCELLNQQAGDGEYLENLDVILDVMDMDNNDAIDINEFFEVTEFNRRKIFGSRSLWLIVYSSIATIQAYVWARD